MEQPDTAKFSIDRQGLLVGLKRVFESSIAAVSKLTVLALVDLKNFSQVNQRHGYANGDKVLAELQIRGWRQSPKIPPAAAASTVINLPLSSRHCLIFS